MDSKLPKPTGLKRPNFLPVQTKNILPTDRIKPNGVVHSSSLASKTVAGAGAASSNYYNSSSYQPLTRDIINLNHATIVQKRKSSPEPKISSRGRDLQMGSKLRRSRSACDIREMKSPRKRMEPTLSTISSKISRFDSVGGGIQRANSSSAFTTTATTKTMRQFRTNNATVAASAAKRPIVTRKPLGRTATSSAIAAVKDNKVTKTTTSSAPTTSTKTTSTTTTRKIPPYDFKARFQDLLEKHKTLKSKYEKLSEDMVEMESLSIQLEETQNKLIEVETELKNVKVDNDCLRRQVNLQNSKIDSITCSLGCTTAKLTELQGLHKIVVKERDELSTEVVALRKRCETLEILTQDQSVELVQCKEQLFQSNMDRKELHNTVMDLRGNIRVFCRVRPPLACEDNRSLCGWNYQDEATVEIQNLDANKYKQGSLIFNFDQVFHPNSEQTDIFEMVSPLIQSALDGYNICIFAYGQTGSGKTFTMDGVPDNVGVIPRTVDLLFDSIKSYKHLGWKYEIKVTFLEIYNEVLYDLLSNEQKEMEIRMAKNNKNDIYVSNITEETVTCADHLRHLMNVAKSNRATAATVGNERSSRSHAVTKLELIGRHAEKQEISVGTINLVDLAGSESPKTSIRMIETKNINRSLSELTNVILALLQKQDHIPYRNSKLTHLLMPSLGGNSKTLMFINVAPFQDCFQESVKSLRFAASVNSCKMSKAKRNRILNVSTASSSFEK